MSTVLTGAARVVAAIHIPLLVAMSAVAVIAAGCGSERPAARVAGTPIAKERVEAILEHASEEAKHEGRVFAANGSPAYRQARRAAIELLVYHEELSQKARALGITVTDAEIEARVGQQEDAEGKGFAEESLRAVLLYQRLYRRVTSDIRVTRAEVAAYYRRRATLYLRRGLSLAEARAEILSDLLTTRRTAAMSAWIERMRREFAPEVSYGKEAAS